MFDRIADQFGIVFNAELLREVHLVRAGGPGTPHEHLGYGVDALARRQAVGKTKPAVQFELEPLPVEPP